MPTVHTRSVHDVLHILLFIVLIILGVIGINTFIFRTYTVVGKSMVPTLQEDDRLFVNKLPVSLAHLVGQQWQPERGQIVVFKNPLWDAGQVDEYIVKRVIGLSGERVVVHQGTLTIYNHLHPEGFQPDKNLSGPLSPTSGEVDKTVEDNAIFVCGDNRLTSHSIDSRNGLSTIPLDSIEGTVATRILPIDKLRWF